MLKNIVSTKTLRQVINYKNYLSGARAKPQLVEACLTHGQPQFDLGTPYSLLNTTVRSILIPRYPGVISKCRGRSKP